MTLGITMAPIRLMGSNVFLHVTGSMCECFSEGGIERLCCGNVLKSQK